MIPFYIFYSMFGFQRTGDQFWQFADQLGRGFVLGATAGRTTLTGEGLQHADGHSHAARLDQPGRRSPTTRPSPTRSRHIVQSGLQPDVRLVRAEHPHGEDVFFYLTIYNEPIQQPAEPADVDVEGILRGHPPGARRRSASRAGRGPSCSPPAWRCPGRCEAQELLGQDWGVDVGRLVGDLVERAAPRRAGRRRAQPPAPGRRAAAPRTSPRKLADASGPVVAVSDYMRAVPDQIAQWVPARTGSGRSLGADGFGFADTRGAARRFFHIDAESIVVARPGPAGQARRGQARSAARRAGAVPDLDVAAADAGSTGGDA